MEGWGGNLVPVPGGSGRRKPHGLRKINFHFENARFCSGKRLGDQITTLRWQNPLPTAVELVRGPRFCIFEINVRDAFSQTMSESFLLTPSPLFFNDIFWNFQSEDATERTTPKVNEWPLYFLLTLRDAVHSTKWRCPLVNLFPPPFFGLFFFFFHVFLPRVQQNVSGSAPPQHPPDTTKWTLFRCSLRG